MDSETPHSGPGSETSGPSGNLAIPEVTLAAVQDAARRIRAYIQRPPLEKSRWLSVAGRAVWLKLESLQTTGSFKLRGAAAKLTALTDQEKSVGVLPVSAGNHGLATAYMCERLGLPATIVVPASASPAKIAALRRYQINLMLRGDGYDDAERTARLIERQSGMVFVSPYNDPMVIAGQGTIALEILEDAPDLDALVVPVGGGGLLAGALVAAKALKPEIRVFGVEPAASPTMKRALEAGRIVHVTEDHTIADGLAGNIETGSITFPIIESLVDEIILVDERRIAAAITAVAREDHLMVEGSAAVSIAALDDPVIAGRKIAAILTGRNIDLGLFATLIREGN